MRTVIFFTLALCCAFCWPQPGRASLALDGRFEVESGYLLFSRDGGMVLTRRSLVGQAFVVAIPGDSIEIRIDGLDEHEDDSGHLVPLYRISARLRAGHAFKSLCGRDAAGREAAIAYLGESGRVSLTCTSGAEGKCILLGYRPWEKVGEISLHDVHAACVRMIRADYGGDDLSYTKDGTQIVFRDNLGIRDFPKDNRMPFEAAWGTDGALCVAHPRVSEVTTLEDLAKTYLGLSGALGPQACDEATMAANPKALLLNRSR
ncbi:ADYC domain-containing protein [Microvirga sp. 2MCAF38]|uniref:ADYC domain-containing protein n=1 Tax=Microvirga sp. 2MCAF38 TaxID=3232989 RepID=UPI003F96F429